MKSSSTTTSASIGVLIHVYHLETLGWEALVWGDEDQDRLGSWTTLANLLLNRPLGELVDNIIICSGPSARDGLTEAAYMKQFLVDRLAKLDRFPRLKPKLAALSAAEREAFEQKLRNIVVGPVIKNTVEEVAYAAKFFQEHGVNTVVQIASASHAPRCMKTQTVARYQGLIPPEQQWSVMASDVCFAGTTPEDVVVVEPLHRGDDPMRDFKPALGQLLKPYFSLSVAEKQAFHKYLERAEGAKV